MELIVVEKCVLYVLEVVYIPLSESFIEQSGLVI
jgi:hypothetical protein